MWSYVVLIVVLLLHQPAGELRGRSRESLLASIGSGANQLLQLASIRAAVVRGFFFALSGISVTALMPLVARGMKGSAFDYGFLLGSFGCGAVICALFLPQIRVLFSSDRIAYSASITIGASLWAIASGDTLIILLPVYFTVGGVWLLGATLFNLVIQTSAPEGLQARALALYYLSFFGGMTLGGFGFGDLADLAGVSAALTMAGVLQLASCLLVMAMPLASRISGDEC